MSYRGRAAGTIGDVPPDDPLRNDVRAYYEAVSERPRLFEGYGPLERVRTQEVLLRHLPAAPAAVADIGGGAGVHAIWLAHRGYAVHLRDLAGVHVAQAEEDAAAAGVRLASAGVADARALDLAGASVDVVLLLGRCTTYRTRPTGWRALAEARRVLRPGGLLAAAAISRAAPVLDGLRLGLLEDPAHRAMCDEITRSGRSDPPPVSGFTSAYMHTASGLRAEVSAAGFDVLETVGLEGLAWAFADLDERWADPAGRAAVLEAARRVEAADEVIGLSPHLLCVAR